MVVMFLRFFKFPVLTGVDSKRKLKAKRIRRLPGFTLIELLAVIAVVGILAAILIPAMQGVRTRAEETKKVSNYRQYFIANNLYAQDHGGNTVPAKDGRISGDENLWMTLLSPYLEDARFEAGIYRDPFFEAYDPETPWVTGAGVNVDIGLPESTMGNVFWGGEANQYGTEYKLQTITHPEYRIFLGDSRGWFLGSNNFDASRHDEGRTGMFVRFDGSVTYYTEVEAGLAITDPGEVGRL